MKEEEEEAEEEEEEESLFKADAVRRRRRRKVYTGANGVNEERTPSATALPRCRRLVPPYYVPEGGGGRFIQS